MTVGHEQGSDAALRELAAVIGVELTSLVDRMNVEMIARGMFTPQSVAELRRLRLAAERSLNAIHPERKVGPDRRQHS